MTTRPCPLCGDDVPARQDADAHRFEFFDHGTCGHFHVSPHAETYFRGANEAIRALERTRVRVLNAKGVTPHLVP